MDYGSKEELIKKYGSSAKLIKARPPLECAQEVYSWMERQYEVDKILDQEPDARTPSSLCIAAIANLQSQMELMHWLSNGTDRRVPRHILALSAEFQNLRDGVPSRLLRHDGATMGDNPKDARRLAFQAYAAVLLQLFMDRDGRGSQMAAAERIAKVLAEAGFTPPGRGAKNYTARTTMGWLREARSKDNQLAQNYKALMKLFKEKNEINNLEEKLRELSENIKRTTYDPENKTDG